MCMGLSVVCRLCVQECYQQGAHDDVPLPPFSLRVDQPEGVVVPSAFSMDSVTCASSARECVGGWPGVVSRCD
jgi:hypothetical protein